MICWYCHWGWPEQVVEIYRRGVEAAGEGVMCFGPSHIVWADENFSDVHIRSCIELATAHYHNPGFSDDEISVVLASLRELLAVPENIRCCEPDNYDGEHPGRFPPPPGMIMLSRTGKPLRAGDPA